MTEYVVLIVGDEDRWWSATEEDRAAGYAEFERFAAEVMGRGHTITAGAELHRSSEARAIPAGGGDATDGPFTETTEQVGGFFVIESDDLDDLLDCCQIIAKLGDGIEVRRTVQPEERAG